MSIYDAILKTGSDPAGVLRSMLQKMLSEKLADALLVAAKTPYSSLPMPTLFTEPENMEGVDPLAPVAPINAARQAAALVRQPAGKRIAMVLRPCEIRAFIELVKLKQCVLDDVILIGIECLGRMENNVFLKHLGKNQDITSAFYKDADLQTEITSACRGCDHFQPYGADITVCVLGGAVSDQIGFLAGTVAGEKILTDLGLPSGTIPEQREAAVADLLKKRVEAKDKLFTETAHKINTMEGFQRLIGNCLNCYNCRMACPVCYCRECVFMTDVFAHDPEVLLRRASKRGPVKMPTETVMFHMTRLVHMAHACVGCGQCSSVCPSDIPVADIFRTVAAQTQAMFDYEPGRDVTEPIPQTVFKEEAT